ncbi:hypothetical protein JQ629_18150 [Bradyrhizobium sp. AUGA SZCCT0222]|uniref:hypothetical protein n=1 Tax=Bradyrhizobium sp. AUGA SZCCT0222 TaxID=2807668 RepID=UPI001BA533DB|nr:hypothetical protein [Bradyrhizobium sp. AUGA SZCCT0222]MBR1269438.1 hypothetical protein [Bradyrhizobium sp. AUGA SZCCT0222]
MSNLGEFSSLLQLGVGFGIGLSFFRAPMMLLLGRLEHDLAKEMDVLDKVQTSHAGRAKAELSGLQMDISKNIVTLDRLNMPFMIAALMGAAVNWAALIYASLFAQNQLTSTEEWILIAISVGWFLLITVSVGIAALIYLLPLSRRLKAIRARV